MPNAGGVLNQLEIHVLWLERVYAARNTWNDHEMERLKNESNARQRANP